MPGKGSNIWIVQSPLITIFSRFFFFLVLDISSSGPGPGQGHTSERSHPALQYFRGRSTWEGLNHKFLLSFPSFLFILGGLLIFESLQFSGKKKQPKATMFARRAPASE